MENQYSPNLRYSSSITMFSLFSIPRLPFTPNRTCTDLKNPPLISSKNLRRNRLRRTKDGNKTNLRQS